MKYLIVKTSSLGDILQTYPVATYLRERSPYGQIDWLVEEGFAPLVEAHPAVDKAIIAKRKGKIPYSPQLRTQRYDTLFDLQGNCKSGALTLQARARVKVGYRWEALPERLSGVATNLKFPLKKGMTIREDYLYLVQQFFDDFSSVIEKPFLFPLKEKEREAIAHIGGGTLVCPGAAWPNKRLPRERLVALLERCEGQIYFSWGSEEERFFLESLTSYGTILPKLSLAQLQNVMAKSVRVICMDSLPLHLCATTETPALAFFGPSSLQKFLPPGAEGVQGACPYGVKFERRCPYLRSCRSASCIDIET